MRLSSLLLVICASLPQLLHAVKFEEYILAPASRELKPSSVFNVNGAVTGAERLLGSHDSAHQRGASISGTNSSVTYDFGKNVGGRIQLNVGQVSGSGEILGLTYSESSLWVSSEMSDNTNGMSTIPGDLPFQFNITKPGLYTVPEVFMRGGFKYLTVTLHTSGTVGITNLQLNYTAMPHFKDMRAYTGYFHCNDELLNRIWYAGAYTNQLCTISPSQGDAFTQSGIVDPGQSASPPGVTFFNTTITNGSSTVVDGAKRDRLVFPGDFTVSFPSIAVSTYDLISFTNGLDSLYIRQDSAGQLPYVGFPFPGPPDVFSDTYHLYNLVNVAEHFKWSGNVEYLRGKWDAWKRGMAWTLGTIDETGLVNVTRPNDWLRFGLGAHAIEVNAILYGALGLGLSLADALNDSSVVADYTNNMTTVKAAANAWLWDSSAGLYRDNETTTLHPQDGNAWALRAGLFQNNSQALAISNALQRRWTAFGAVAVEAGNAISPFISSLELEAHFSLNNTDTALELIRRQWGFMLNDPRTTQSTFIEGYNANGSLHYPPVAIDSIISHAHGWSTGPTYSLTTYVAGLRITSQAGQTWMVWPQPGDLISAEAGLSTSLGKFSVSWKLTGTSFSLQFEAPPGTSGSVMVPTFHKTNVSYTIVRLDDDKKVDVSSKWRDEQFVGQDGLEGGKYLVTAQYSTLRKKYIPARVPSASVTAVYIKKDLTRDHRF